MAQAFSPGLKIVSRTMVRKHRELPLLGEVLVHKGDLVKAEATVAAAEKKGEMHILRVAENLGVQPQEVIAGLKVKVGDSVGIGQLLCEHVGLWGLFRSRFNSTAEGVVEVISETTGHIGVREKSKRIELQSYISGEVVELIEKKGVVVQTEAALVQGIFGVGGERVGKIRMLEVDANEAVDLQHIPEDLSAAILVGGRDPTIAALQKASNGGAVGFVTGSIDDRTLAQFVGYDLGIAVTGDEPVTMSLIITEGFGSLPISRKILDLLRPLAGFEGSINGTTQVRAGAVRPEIIVPLGGSGAAGAAADDQVVSPLQIGSKIRIVRAPYFGLNAEVVELPHEQELLETGAKIRVLRARLEGEGAGFSGKVVTVPRANVEVRE